MSIITFDNELDVVIVEPLVPDRTVRRRRALIVQLAWEEFAYGGPQTTPRSAMRRALNRYLPELGLWIKSCTVCSGAFKAKRRDATYCSNACRMRAARRSG